MNPLFQNQQGQPQQFNPAQNLFQQFQQFKNSFNGGDEAAKQQIQQMLNSGRISQQQYNQTVQMAQQLWGNMK